MESSREDSVRKEEDERQVRWIIRPMKHADIDKCLIIWSQVELTEAKQTVSSALKVDPQGFYVAELLDSGEIIGMCAGPMTRPDTAFMGFYGVDPQFQRMGIGKELWAKTMKRLSGYNVGLYGVPTMSAKYRKSGFVVEDSIRMLVFESQAHSVDKLKIDALKEVQDLQGCCRLVSIDNYSTEQTFQKLVQYDEAVQNFNRESLLRVYLANSQDTPLTVVLVRKSNDTAASSKRKSSHEQRKSSCCVKSSTRPEATIDEIGGESAVSSNLSSVSSNSLNDLRTSVADSTTTTTTTGEDADSRQLVDGEELLGYGCIRVDNNNGGIIGPIYADSREGCEAILRHLMTDFNLERGRIYSAMALTSNKDACELLTKVGMTEIEQCSRMFTKFVPEADFTRIFYVHSPNFTLF